MIYMGLNNLDTSAKKRIFRMRFLVEDLKSTTIQGKNFVTM